MSTVTRKRKHGYIEVDTQIIRWRKRRKAAAKAKAKLAGRDILRGNIFK